MVFSIVKRTGWIALVAAALLVGNSVEAQARWHACGCSYWTPSYYTWYTPSYYSPCCDEPYWYSSYWSYPVTYPVAYPSCSTCYSSYGSSVGYVAGDSSKQPAGSSASQTSTLVNAVTYQATSKPAPAVAKPGENRYVGTKFQVIVPENAVVFVNDLRTKSTGTLRQYQSALEYGKSYDFVLRANMQRDGRTVEETRTIHVTGGQDRALAVNFTSSTDIQVAARQ
jgi:uncharacterized protein (TIGR03000 family)